MFESFKEAKKPEGAEVVSRDDAVLDRVKQELKANPTATPETEASTPSVEADVNLHAQPTDAKRQEHFDEGKSPHGFESL